MLHFDCDYMEGAHPQILERLLQTNLEQTPGYGTDCYCDSAKEKIRAACGCPEAAVHFLVGGTQTNATVIDALLQSFEGVVAADTGHVSVHEAGAIELGGHKVLTLPNHDGKLTADELRRYLEISAADGNRDHMVFPGMVYISFPTEFGTLYSAAELEAIYTVCQAFSLPLFVDGARLGYGLTAPGNDITLPFLAAHCDVFYIGGTKVGALFGEAVVFPNKALSPHFFTIMKQHGALLAKGRLLGIQFDTLLTDDLYLKIAQHANDMAARLRRLFTEKGYRFLLDAPTNQLILVVPNDRMKQLAKHTTFSFWEKADDTHTVIRFCTSWATREADIDALASIL